MKPLIVGICTILIYCFTLVMITDVQAHQRQNEYIKYVCDQTSISASLFNDTAQYGEGKIVFNQTEGIKIIEDQMKVLLKLNSTFVPNSDTYWQDKVTYKAYFFDDSNTIYPYNFTDQDSGYSKIIYNPTVIVTINAGKARYSIPLVGSNNANIRSGAHEWEDR